MKKSIWKRILNGEQVLPEKQKPAPKFNLWDEVYTLRNSRVQKVTVCGIYSFEEFDGEITLHLQFELFTSQTSGVLTRMVYKCPQDDAFATKEELLASL